MRSGGFMVIAPASLLALILAQQLAAGFLEFAFDQGS